MLRISVHIRLEHVLERNLSSTFHDPFGHILSIIQHNLTATAVWKPKYVGVQLVSASFQRH